MFKVLFVIPHDFIPSNSGNKTLLHALLQGVSPHVECDLAILSETPRQVLISRIQNELPHLKEVYVFPKSSGSSLFLSRLRFMLSGFHPVLGRYRNSELERWLECHASIYNLIHFDMMYVAPYQAFCGTIPTLLVASDAYSMSAKKSYAVGKMRWVYAGSMLIQEWWLRNFEKKNYPLFDMVCTVSDVDAAWLKAISHKATIETIGIGLSSEYAESSIRHFAYQEIVKKKILCTGSLNHRVVAEGMINFLLNSVPLLLLAHSDLTVIILGKDPLPELKRCMAKFEGVVVHVDFVDDYAAFLDDDWIYVYPQQCGSGLQTKVQQAMALGLPVVGFVVSFGGLRVESGKHCFICTDIDEMTQNVVALIESQNLRKQIGLAASNHVREQFSIKRIGAEMLSLYKMVIDKSALHGSIQQDNRK